MVLRNSMVLMALLVMPAVAMQNESKKRKQDEEQSQNVKRRQEKITIRNFVDTAPTWQEIALAFYKSTLTAEMVTKYAMSRLNARIAYWRLRHQEWQKRWGKGVKGEGLEGAAEELLQIPFYITHALGEVTPEKMLDRVVLFSDKDAREVHEGWSEKEENCKRDVPPWKTFSTASGYNISSMRTGRSIMFLKDFGWGSKGFDWDSLVGKGQRLAPFEFLTTIEHELSHVEQAQNRHYAARSLKNNQVDGYMSDGVIDIMTDRVAHEFFRRFKFSESERIKLKLNNRFDVAEECVNADLEREAEYKSLFFNPSRIGEAQYCGYMIRKGFVEKGACIGKDGYYTLGFYLKTLRQLGATQQDKEAYTEVYAATKDFGSCNHSARRKKYDTSLLDVVHIGK